MKSVILFVLLVIIIGSCADRCVGCKPDASPDAGPTDSGDTDTCDASFDSSF